MIEPTEPLLVVSDERLTKIISAIQRHAAAWGQMTEESRDEIYSLLVELQDARELILSLGLQAWMDK